MVFFLFFLFFSYIAVNISMAILLDQSASLVSDATLTQSQRSSKKQQYKSIDVKFRQHEGLFRFATYRISENFNRY